jgi:hypothetical protein
MSNLHEFELNLGPQGGYEYAVATMAAHDIMSAYERQKVKDLDAAIIEAGYKPNTLVVRSIIDWLRRVTKITGMEIK